MIISRQTRGVVEEYGLRLNNSTLTGDAIAVRKSADASIREGLSDLERPNLVFAGTSVVSGTGKAVVHATGMLTNSAGLPTLPRQSKRNPLLCRSSLPVFPAACSGWQLRSAPWSL